MAKIQALHAAAPPPRSPERERLAAAIEQHAAAVQRPAEVRRARERAFERFIELEAAAGNAAAVLAQAKAQEGARLVAELMGAPEPGALSVKDATAAAEAVTVALDDLRRARAALDDQEREAERQIEWSRYRLIDAQCAVVKADPAVAELLAAFDVTHRRLADLRRALEFLDRNSALPGDARFWMVEREWPDLPGAAPWRAALEALATDPDAPLPGVEKR